MGALIQKFEQIQTYIFTEFATYYETVCAAFGNVMYYHLARGTDARAVEVATENTAFFVRCT